jgi:hypothetical protein
MVESPRRPPSKEPDKANARAGRIREPSMGPAIPGSFDLPRRAVKSRLLRPQ